MRIGGFQKTSLLDYPEHLSAIVWTSGCNFRCPFCYNRDLVLEKRPLVSSKEIFSYLKKRQGKLEAIVITGGEPTLQEDLADFIEKVKEMDYLVKLDTNGASPDILEDLLNNRLVDYVAMDIKAPQEHYRRLSGAWLDPANIQQSIGIIKTQAPDYEFRTTVVPGLLKKEDIISIARWLDGAKRYILQQFTTPGKLIGKRIDSLNPYPKEFFEDLQKAIKNHFAFCEIRGI